MYQVVQVSWFSVGCLRPTEFRCPGYELQSLIETDAGLTAHLRLAGPACNAFGTDVDSLTVQVTYETQSRYVSRRRIRMLLTDRILRLHVNIYDTENKQYTIPDSVISLPAPPTESFTRSSDLIFNYEPSPFAFWITRRSQPSAIPLFDTRVSSLPSTPTSIISTGSTIAFDGFPLVFENQYLQVRHTFLLSQIASYSPQISSDLPLDTNIYGLGEVVASSGFRRDVRGTIQTLWNRDAADPIDENM